MKKILLPLILLLTVATACGNTSCNTEADGYVEIDNDTVMDLDADIGEMLLVGFRGTTLDSTNHIWRDLTHFRVGSVILFDYDAATGRRGRNIASAQQVKELCLQLHSISPTLLIGIDQEGGRVSRLSPRYGFTAVASAQASATAGDDSVRQCARLTAQMLHEAGINLNFAPVADVDVNPACPVIGGMGRSFSADPARVTACCSIWIDEQQRKGVASCLKHFPGHGSATGDTHKGLVDVSNTWQRAELIPYKELINDAPMVMTAHVVNRQLDPSGLPASLSPAITAYLRDTLGFAGIIVTDDLAMGAIVEHYSFEHAIEMAVTAGADLLCLSNNGGTYDTEQVPRAVRTIKNMVANGTVSAERIHESAKRIRALKATLK